VHKRLQGLSVRKSLTLLIVLLPLSFLRISWAQTQNIDLSAQLEKLQDQDIQVRLAAVGELQKMGTGRSAAVLILVKVMQSNSDEFVRSLAASSLGYMAPDPDIVLPPLILALQKDPSEFVRQSAADSLGRLGSRAKAAIPALVVAIQVDTFHWARSSAAMALGQIGLDANEVVPVLMKVTIEDKDSNVRSQAARSTGRFGPKARMAVPNLIQAMQKDSDPEVRSAAAGAFGEIGPDARSAVPALISTLETDKNGEVRSEAARSLGGIGPEARTAVPALIRVMKQDPYQLGRESSTFALGKIGAAGGPEVVSTLIDIVQNEPDPELRLDALQSLGDMGSDAQTAIPVLLHVLHGDGSKREHLFALRAITAIAESLRQAGNVDSLSQLRKVPGALGASPESVDPEMNQLAARVQGVIDYWEVKQKIGNFKSLILWVHEHRWASYFSLRFALNFA
jgi:HEAT repeat protein